MTIVDGGERLDIFKAYSQKVKNVVFSNWIAWFVLSEVKQGFARVSSFMD